MSITFAKVKEKIKNAYPKGSDRSMSYGTAGFRGSWNNLDWVMFRMGLLGVLRSKHQKGRAIGVMVTASHNPVGDNGIKLIDPNGEMLATSWESVATELVNAGDVDVVNVLRNIITRFNIDFSASAIVYLAHDTRPSSTILSTAVRDGVEALGASVKDFHLLTTPQLHHIVNAQNSSFGVSDELDNAAVEAGTASVQEDPSEEGYYSKLSEAFVGLLSLRDEDALQGKDGYESEIYVDGANGIGAMKLAELRSRLCNRPELLDSPVKLPTIRIFNDGQDGVLNENCGADHVKVIQKPPKGSPIAGGVKYVSFDGDADRLVYFHFNEEGQFQLLDGDKIATLLSSFFADLVRECGVDLQIGIVQTAYANGASTQFIEDVLKVPVVCVPTGVKHLHQKAKDYDIGIYFEANGHGTVLFSPHAQSLMHQILSQNDGEVKKKKIKTPENLITLTETENRLPTEDVIKPESPKHENMPPDEAISTSDLVDVLGVSQIPQNQRSELSSAEDVIFEKKGHEEHFVPIPELPVPPSDNLGVSQAGVVEKSREEGEKEKSGVIGEKKSPGELLALRKLLLASQVINQTVGDAIADMLLVEAVLFLRGLSMKTWDAFYHDLPNRQLKVKVQDREVVQTTDAERRCSAPPGLQAFIDQTVKKYHQARAFIRPSGTEDVVRVYAEADTQENADRLAQEVAYQVFQMAGGIGPCPPATLPPSAHQPAHTPARTS